MKKIIILLILVQSMFAFIYSQFYIEANSGVTVNLNSASVTGVLGAYVCGDSGTVIKTTNTGITWSNISGNGIPANINLVNIFAVDNNTVLTVGNIGTTTFVYRTVNSGINWTQVFSQANGCINAINVRSTLIGFMCGNPVNGRWSLWKTTNGGLNWDSAGLRLIQSSNESGFSNSLYSTNTRIWFGTNNSRIYFSSNYGYNWLAISTSPELNSSAVWLFRLDTTYGYTGGDMLLRTTDSGFNWSIVTPVPGAGRFGGFTWGTIFVDEVFPPPIAWFVRNDNKIYSSYSGGTWGSSYTAPSGTYRYISDHNNPGEYVYAVRNSGGITKFSSYLGAINKISSEIPSSFSLYQNYPNPFNPTTKIRFSLPSPSEGEGQGVRVIIYDIFGREVATLVNEQLKPGTYEVEFDGSGFASGVYFYSLITSEYTETKKLILLK